MVQSCGASIEEAQEAINIVQDQSINVKIDNSNTFINTGDSVTITDVRLESELDFVGPKVDRSCMLEAMNELQADIVAENENSKEFAGGEGGDVGAESGGNTTENENTTEKKDEVSASMDASQELTNEASTENTSENSTENTSENTSEQSSEQTTDAASSASASTGLAAASGALSSTGGKVGFGFLAFIIIAIIAYIIYQNTQNK